MYTLVLVGELDRSSTTTLEAAIEGLCEREVAGITLDLSKLTRIDATGVAVIAFRSRWCERNGCAFALVHGSASVRREFERAGALARLPFVEQGRHSEEGTRVLVARA
jgi:anti-anti-sigma factor